MKVRIHRGAHEIGGNCIELMADDGRRIVLDVGRPLSAGPDDDVPLPPVSGFSQSDPTLLAVVLSHPHLDHYGLVRKLPSSVPIWMGEEAAAVVNASAFFSPQGAAVDVAEFLCAGRVATIGPFRITPSLNDHSAFDAYSLLIEADGRRVFYTGDLRAHGRKAELFEELVAHPPRDIDVLLMEGTHVRADRGADAVHHETEGDLEGRFTELLRDTAGAVVVLGSAQNLDRLVTVFRAALRSGRTLVIDLYGATVAAATRSSIPQPGFDRLRVYVPQRQRVLVKESEQFERVAAIRAHRVFAEELVVTPERFVFHVPSSTTYELVKSQVLTPAGRAVWSLWPGYLRAESGKRLTSFLAERGIGFEVIHTSGHASVPDLQRLVAAMAPQRVVPIHSEATERFAELFPRVERHSDGDWWSV